MSKGPKVGLHGREKTKGRARPPRLGDSSVFPSFRPQAQRPRPLSCGRLGRKDTEPGAQAGRAEVRQTPTRWASPSPYLGRKVTCSLSGYAGEPEEGKQEAWVS